MVAKESELFMAEMADVKPIRSSASHFFADVPADADTSRARRLAADMDERLTMLPLEPARFTRVKADEIVEFSREGVQDGVLKQLRLGRYPAKVRFDFRGLSLKEARLGLLAQLDSALYRGDRNMLLICGKGRDNKPFEAMMKSALVTWLASLAGVMAFHSATREEGGSGALYVMLEKSEAQKIHSRETNRKGARR